MKKLNICLVSLSIAPDRERTGFEGIYNYLKKKGHNVKLITGKWNYELNDPDIIQLNLIRKRFFWVPQFNLKVAHYLKKHKFDIVHGNGPKGTLPIILSNQKRFITTLHDLGPFESKFTIIPMEKHLIKYIAQKATYITTVSKFSKRGINHFIPKIDPKKIHNLYNGIDENYKPYPEKAQRFKESLNLEGPVLLYLGRIANYKGMEHIITAYRLVKRKIPNVNLVIGGIPDYNMAKIYKKWKNEYKDITFLGFVPEKIVPIVYSLADIFITYSSSSEGFGNTSLEAIACGTPAICSSLVVFREILEDNAIFVEPNNPDLLAKEILNLLKNEILRKDMVDNAQKFIKKYTWNAVGKRLEKVYSKFLSN